MSDTKKSDPLSLMRRMTSSLERAFDEWHSFSDAWYPRIDVFERDRRLVTRVDLPGMKKEEVTVEVSDGHLILSGERKREIEETKDNVYRKEREHGSFYRVVPLPDGTKVEDVKATFADGVLEVSAPLPAAGKSNARSVPIEEPKAGAKSAA